MSKRKNSPVVVSYTTPRRRSNQPKVAPEGVPTIEPMSADIIELNFVKRVELLENGCWLWHGSVDTPHGKNKRPVPTFFAATNRANHKVVRAYAYAYEKRIGELPDQKKIALVNTCGLDLCANPYHYKPTPRTEIMDTYARPAQSATAKANPMCRNGLHERTPENTLYQGKDKKGRCAPCTRETQKAKYYRNKAKKSVS